MEGGFPKWKQANAFMNVDDDDDHHLHHRHRLRLRSLGPRDDQSVKRLVCVSCSKLLQSFPVSVSANLQMH